MAQGRGVQYHKECWAPGPLGIPSLQMVASQRLLQPRDEYLRAPNRQCLLKMPGLLPCSKAGEGPKAVIVPGSSS